MICKRDSREKEVQAVIAAGMVRQGMKSRTTLANAVHVPRSTLNRHINEVREMKVGELWDIVDALEITDEDKQRLI